MITLDNRGLENVIQRLLWMYRLEEISNQTGDIISRRTVENYDSIITPEIVLSNAFINSERDKTDYIWYSQEFKEFGWNIVYYLSRITNWRDMYLVYCLIKYEEEPAIFFNIRRNSSPKNPTYPYFELYGEWYFDLMPKDNLWHRKICNRVFGNRIFDINALGQMNKNILDIMLELGK